MTNKTAITANELRLGNWIASGIVFGETSIIGKVLEIGNEEREFEQIYCECSESFEWFFKGNYCGIPLTHEILEKIGKRSTVMGDTRTYWIIGDFLYCEDEPTLNKGLHWLQNFHYFKTGEELPLTL